MSLVCPDISKKSGKPIPGSMIQVELRNITSRKNLLNAGDTVRVHGNLVIEDDKH